jgi:hypothetical protein
VRHRSTLAVVPVLLAAATLVTASTLHAQQLDIQGTWIRTSADGSHQRGAILFTPTSYSFMAVLGDEPRAETQGNGMTDEEILAAYRSFAANAGRYRLEGNQLIFEAYMARNPNYMAAWPDNDRTWTLEMDGDNRLLITNDNGVVSQWVRPTQDGVPVR